MRVLSLCDGISNTMYALKQMGIPIEVYYACEIDKSAISISRYNFPEIIQLGDLTKLGPNELDALGHIDLLTYGSPCQSLSIASAASGKRADCKNGEKITGKSSLFYECLRIQRYLKPTYWICENVASMSKEAKAEFEKELGVPTVLLDGKMFSAQRRRRYFFSNIKFEAPPESEWDTTILRDILQVNVPEKYYLSEEQQKKIKWLKKSNEGNECEKIGYIETPDNPGCRNYPASQGTLVHDEKGKYTAIPATPRGLNWVAEKPKHQQDIVGSPDEKMRTICAGVHGSGPHLTKTLTESGIRRLTPIEVERLFNLDGYKLEVIINLCENIPKNIQNTYANVENQCGIRKELVKNVEKDKKQENVRYVGNNLLLKNQETVNAVLGNVELSIEELQENKIQNKEIKRNVDIVEKNIQNHLRSNEDFVLALAAINLELVKMDQIGKVELPQSLVNFITVKNGKIFVTWSGEEMEQYVENVVKSMTINVGNLKSIILNLSQDTQKIEQNLKILFYYVMSVIRPFIQENTQNIILTKHFGYTQYGIDEKGNIKEMKDGPRYTALGNSFLWKKIEYILRHSKDFNK